MANYNKKMLTITGKFLRFWPLFLRKKVELAPSAEKKKALGLALSVKKNSGLARPKKKELAPFEIKNRGASPIRQWQASSRFASRLLSHVVAESSHRSFSAKRLIIESTAADCRLRRARGFGARVPQLS